jgi:D-arginine dehydrogenase
MDDFLIIGGGIAGTSAAARLAAHGRVSRFWRPNPRLATMPQAAPPRFSRPPTASPSTVALNRASYDFHAAEAGAS